MATELGLLQAGGCCSVSAWASHLLLKAIQLNSRFDVEAPGHHLNRSRGRTGPFADPRRQGSNQIPRLARRELLGHPAGATPTSKAVPKQNGLF